MEEAGLFWSHWHRFFLCLSQRAHFCNWVAHFFFFFWGGEGGTTESESSKLLF